MKDVHLKSIITFPILVHLYVFAIGLLIDILRQCQYNMKIVNIHFELYDRFYVKM